MAKQLTEAQKKAKAKADKVRRAKAKVAADKKAKIASASRGTKPVKAAPEKSGEPTRKMFSGPALRKFAQNVMSSQDSANSAGGAVGAMITAKVKDKSAYFNGPAFRLVLRLLKKGMTNPAAGRVLLDDVLFYIDELEVAEHCGDSLFAPREGAQDGEEAEPGAETEGTTELPDGVSRLDDHRDTAAA